MKLEKLSELSELILSATVGILYILLYVMALPITLMKSIYTGIKYRRIKGEEE